MIVTGVDKSAFTGFTKQLYPTYDNYRKSGKLLCPKSYKGRGEPAWYESLWDFASGGVSWASGLYADIKKMAVKTVASAINALPGTLCNATCEKGLMADLNTELIVLGVPPNLPTLEQLTDQGMNYLVEVAASQAGIDCDQECQNIIRSGIKEMAKQATVASYCGNVELAHINGKEPLCLPPGVTAIPAPQSANQPANATVRVIRNSGAISAYDPKSVRLLVSFSAVNPYTAGESWSVPTNTCYSDTSVFPCDPVIIKTPKPLSGGLFNSKNLNPPPLMPGQSVDIPLFLEASDYWIPEHLAAIKKRGGHVKYNDWWKLYRGAKLTVKADVHCPRIVSAPMASCVKRPAVMYYSIPRDAN